MKLSEVAETLDAKILHGTPDMLNTEVRSAAASDLMSDILARTHVPDILLTRLTNAQVIHTSSIFGIKAVIVVRNKTLDPQVISVAQEESVALLHSPCSLFESCGRLYANGLLGEPYLT